MCIGIDLRKQILSRASALESETRSESKDAFSAGPFYGTACRWHMLGEIQTSRTLRTIKALLR